LFKILGPKYILRRRQILNLSTQTYISPYYKKKKKKYFSFINLFKKKKEKKLINNKY